MATDLLSKKKLGNWNPSNFLQKKLLKLCSAAKKGDQVALTELIRLSNSSSEVKRILASIATTNGSGPLREKFSFIKRASGWASIVQGGLPGLGKHR